MTEQSKSNIGTVVRDYILTEFLAGEDPATLKDTTPLISGGILDSIANARLVSFLEERFAIRFKPHEISSQHFETVASIVDIVDSKKAG